MPRFFVICIVLTVLTGRLLGQTSRFVIDDDAYSDQIVQAAEKLHQQHKLISLDSLRRQVRTKGIPMNLAPVAREKLEPPQICDRLRESTVAVGTFYKCPDCGNWHFSSSTGFIAGEGGIVCTCCHVVTEEDEDIKEGYLVAADSDGHVFPILGVLAADTDADTCLLRIPDTGLKPLPLRPGARAGEPVYCLSHPGGYFFMFTQGMISRLNRRTNADTEAAGQKTPQQSRPVLMLNITAEFAPGSSGAAVVDACGNVVGQAASIADAGEPVSSDQDNPATSPSVPVRFCTATEEILHLANPNLAKESHSPPLRPAKKPKSKMRQLTPGNRCPRSHSAN